MNAWICVHNRNRDLESGLKYKNPTLGCKDIECMEHKLSPDVVPVLLNCLYVFVHLNRQWSPMLHARSDTLECTDSVQTDDRTIARAHHGDMTRGSRLMRKT